MNTSTPLKYQIGITLVKGIGPILARNLISYLGSVEAVFHENAARLQKIPGIGFETAKVIASSHVLDEAEAEIEFMEKNDVTPLFYTNPSYPQRLLNCDDAPVMLYSKGTSDLNCHRILSFVGTRQATEEGRSNCEKLISGVADRFPGTLIASGLAYGIDICSHRASLKSDLPTVGVLAHGLDRIYPHLHRQTAKEMIEKGMLLSEFIHGTPPDKQNFVKRNRIIAGLADATIVVESGIKGGALITARIASSYNRDVFAFPGRTTDEVSAGCNWLIKKNVAALIENVDDLQYFLGWEAEKNKSQVVQKQLFVKLQTEEEKAIYQILLQEREMDINTLCLISKLPISKVAAILLNFEFDGMLKCLPGNSYRMI